MAPPRTAPVVVDAGADAGFDAGAAAREPDNVLDMPDDPVGPEDITDEGRLRALLLRDPRQAERQLVALSAPDQWQVALLAQLALRRGQPAPGALSEDSLGSLLQRPVVTGPGRAWVSVSETVLWAAVGKRARTQLALLPLGTPLEVLALDGGTATVAVEVATTVEYAAASEVEPGLQNEQPVRVQTNRLEGAVDLRQLGASAPDASAVIALAQGEKNDRRAAGLWLHALQLEPSEQARRGLLDVAWRGRRPELVATAALVHETSPALSLAFAWGCSGEPAGAQWARWPLRGKQKGAVCVTGVDTRASCPNDSARRRAAVAEATTAREALGLTERRLLRIVVDGRRARRILLTSAKLEAIDPCADFEEVKVAGWGAGIRRLAVPLGVQRLALLVPVQAAWAWSTRSSLRPARRRRQPGCAAEVTCGGRWAAGANSSPRCERVTPGFAWSPTSPRRPGPGRPRAAASVTESALSSSGLTSRSRSLGDASGAPPR